jgi:hypothetical protein
LNLNPSVDLQQVLGTDPALWDRNSSDITTNNTNNRSHHHQRLHDESDEDNDDTSPRSLAIASTSSSKIGDDNEMVSMKPANMRTTSTANAPVTSFNATRAAPPTSPPSSDHKVRSLSDDATTNPSFGYRSTTVGGPSLISNDGLSHTSTWSSSQSMYAPSSLVTVTANGLLADDDLATMNHPTLQQYSHHTTATTSTNTNIITPRSYARSLAAAPPSPQQQPLHRLSPPPSDLQLSTSDQLHDQ